ncbi:MAG: BTAD domain-containing putative transcriptional regulator [Actinophytocola sp.]|uniref:AfsR/SARP family transcriptional regulator n=1 Tax=Actinophytocola sp. TaxID=1872138 RepID=UPI003C77A929
MYQRLEPRSCAVEVNLLGPLEIRRDGDVLTPSAPKLRTMFSLLVVQANNVVRTDQIIDELWEHNPPTSVTTTLQTYIYQLRKVLQVAVASDKRHSDDNGGANLALRTSPYGYVLDLAEEALDSLRFERLAHRGRSELESGDARAAAESFSSALRLWRGPALVDVGRGPALKTEILRLDEMHKNTLEWRIEADLQLGRHHELLGELTSLAAQQPTHEGIQARLMLALYRAGRRSEALRIYHRARTALATELGVDPSSDLQQMHRAVLTADRSLDSPPSPETVLVTKRPLLPRQLPPDGPSLVGRDVELSATLRALPVGRHNAPPVVLVVGPPGSGKSALCTRVGHLASAQYPDGQLYARLIDGNGRPADPRDVLGEFLRSIDVPDDQVPESTGERCRLFRTCTADKRILVTLDDVVGMGQLLPLLPSSGGCGLLVTGRRRMAAPAITATIQLCPLSMQDSAGLLTDILGEHRVAKEHATVWELIRMCDGLPSALHTSAARLQVRPHWKLSKLVKWISSEIARPVTPGHDAFNLHASLMRTYRLMPSDVRMAFRVLCAMDTTSFSPTLAARVLHTTEPRAEALLDDLADFQFLHVDTGDLPDLLRYRILPILRAVGRQLPPDADDHRPPRVGMNFPAQQDTNGTRDELRPGCEPVS